MRIVPIDLKMRPLSVDLILEKAILNVMRRMTTRML